MTIFNDQGQTDVIFDVAGWVGSSQNSSGPSGMFDALPPSRLLDTRTDGPRRPGRPLNAAGPVPGIMYS